LTRRRRVSVRCRFAIRLIGPSAEEISGGGSIAVTSGRNAVFLGAAPFGHIAAHDSAVSIQSKVGQASRLPRSDASPSGQIRRYTPSLLVMPAEIARSNETELPCWAGGTPTLLTTAFLALSPERFS